MTTPPIPISRRRFLGAAAAAAAAVCVPFHGSTAFAVPGGNGRLVVPGKTGTILYTQRDAISRRGIWSNPEPTMGYLGGPNFPDDPDDLGPLVPLPGGFYEVFQYLSGLGFKQIEFAGYNQNANNRGGANPGHGNPAAYLDYARTLRGFLDEFDLEAIGNHGFIPSTWPGGPGGGMSDSDRQRYELELEFAAILGSPFMGTGGDPTNSSQVEAWDLAGDKWDALNELSLQRGIFLYPHNHADAYNVVQDGPMVEVTEDLATGAPLPAPQIVRSSSGIRRMQYFLDITDPQLCLLEMDIYWATVAQHRFQWYYDVDGNRVHDVFDPLAQVARQTKRYPLFHAKDGDRTTQPPGVGNGYTIVPFGTGDVDFGTFFKNMGARGYHNPNYEQDNAPGGGSDPGQSLRHSAISAHNMAVLRG